ncbi:putative aldouronate transport system substrate-binding protein [Paenibacillus phyllosphaerae]|uniref:Putative aldouronate transport system substrate-binding protein n=1 Tax=Paenibacillus phyllosphaerae TaxID=274593 RepID=A0A7W5B111_9BACL|nr:ABC transporter substrate-binding protein [Paenibacillus phyllosphaerae]MBB3112149.1 putative aldouronate transport system substrate-binding protein [Paenibacillus phyllosphaerae]
MKRKWSMFMALILTFSLVLTACTDDNTAEKEATSEAESSVTMTEPGTFPIVEDKVTLKVLIRGHADVDFETNDFTKWYEEHTNVHLEFEVAPENGFEETLNLALASGNYPDMIIGMDITPATQMLYGKSGTFLPLNEMIEKYGVNMKNIFKDKPLVQQVITAPDGNIYSLPDVGDCFHCNYAKRMWINKVWLDKLGLKMPETTEEYYEVLKAFKEKDPNGNGVSDEIPLAGAVGGWNTEIEGFLMNSFIYNPQGTGQTGMMLDNGKVVAAFTQEKWKAGLDYMNRLYSEGLIAPETFTQDNTQYRQMGEGGDVARVGSCPGGLYGCIAYGKERFKDYVVLPPLAGPDGTRIAWTSPYEGIKSGSIVITNKSKYPEVAFRWADGLLDAGEVSLRSDTGAKGVYWDWAEPGDIGINGKPAIWKKLKEKQPGDNTGWQTRAPRYGPSDFRLGEKRNEEIPLEIILYEAAQKYEPYKVQDDQVLPPLFYSDEQAAELVSLEKSITDYKKEMTARFIIGDADLEQEWNVYLDTLKQMGIDQYSELIQQAYDAR